MLTPEHIVPLSLEGTQPQHQPGLLCGRPNTWKNVKAVGYRLGGIPPKTDPRRALDTPSA